jgi:hypothetical protein
VYYGIGYHLFGFPSGGKHVPVATVYKRKSTYWVRFQWHGKEVRQSACTTSKATAQQFLAQLLD